MLMRLFQAYDWNLQKYQVPNPPPPKILNTQPPRKQQNHPKHKTGSPKLSGSSVLS